jgi:AraC-like DNA-binding protein
MSKAGLPYETLLGDGVMLRFESHIRMLELSEFELDVNALGLVLATRQLVAHLAPIYDVLLDQPNVYTSILALSENIELVAEGLNVQVRTDDDFAYVEMLTDHPFLYNSSIFQDHGAGLLAQYLRWIIGRKFKMQSVSIPHCEPRDILKFRSFFGCPVSFGDSHIAICFDKTILTRPVLGVVDDAKKEYNEILEWDRNASLLAQLRSIIREDIATGASDILFSADALKLSTRTLQRRLSERGTSFHRQLDSVRAGLARQLIYQPGLQIADIASKLGYADPSCFTRAFKRWFGKMPSEWRALMLSKP